MNKNGFTLIELLAVIALLGLISAIAVPSIMAVSENIKDNMLEKKIAMIEEAATLYGEDYKDDVISSSNLYDGSSCLSIKVKDLVPDYVNEDDDNIDGLVINPKDKKTYLDNYEVIIYYKNKRIYAKFDLDDTLNCS